MRKLILYIAASYSDNLPGSLISTLYYMFIIKIPVLLIFNPIRGYNYDLLHIFNEMTFLDKNDPIRIK